MISPGVCYRAAPSKTQYNFVSPQGQLQVVLIC